MGKNRKIRSCFLGRVSTTMESQDSSLVNQKEQIVELILSNKDEQFNPEVDCFEDRVTGTKLKKNNSNEQGFDKLMELLNLEIVHTNNQDYTEIKIKYDKKREPKYNKIYCKSTSRISRAGTSGQTLLEILKENDIEVYFYDLRRSTFELSELELTMFSYMDNNYSRTMSYNTRNNKIIKTKNRELMLHGVRFGYDLVKENGHRYFRINAYEKEIFDLIVELLLEEDKGCDLISQELEKRGYHSSKIQLDKHNINRLLKDKHYLGLEKYYEYPEDYTSKFLVDRSYLKNLNFQWLPCQYIEPLISQERFDLVQEKLQSRSNCGRGQRFPMQPITKKLVCATCGHNFYSLGTANFYKEQAFKCSSRRSKKASLKVDCNNLIFYKNFFDEWQEKQAKNLPQKMNEVIKQAVFDLLHLEHHLALILDKDNNDREEELTDRLEDLQEQLSTKISLLLQNATSETMDIVLKFQNDISNQIKETRKELETFWRLKSEVQSAIVEVKRLQKELDILEDNVKLQYSNKDYLNEIERIYVYPILSGKRRKNRVLFLPLLKIEVEIFDLISQIMDSDILSYLEPNTIHLSNQKFTKKYIVKELPEEKIARAREIIGTLEV